MTTKNEFPAVNVPRATSHHQPHSPNPPQRILVVENDADIRRLNIEVLTHAGYQVDAADSGAAAWGAVRRQHYDLMVAENEMDCLTGIELIRILQKARVDLPTILATDALPDAQFTRYNLLQPARVLFKPYSCHELLAAVKEVLHTAAALLDNIVPVSNRQTPTLRINRLQF